LLGPELDQVRAEAADWLGVKPCFGKGYGVG